MKKENPSNITSTVFSSPKTGQVEDASFAMEIIESLVPGLVGKCPDFAAFVQEFLSLYIRGKTPDNKSKKDLYHHIQLILNKQEHSAALNAKVVYQVIEGMGICILENKLKSAKELASFANTHQDSYDQWLLRAYNSESIDNNTYMPEDVDACYYNHKQADKRKRKGKATP